MLDLSLQNYMDWYVKPVMKIKSAYGFRVILKYTDGSEKVQQKAGFPTKREAEKAREKTIAQLYNGSYIVYANILVSEYMEYWLEHDLRGRAKRNILHVFRDCEKPYRASHRKQENGGSECRGCSETVQCQSGVFRICSQIGKVGYEHLFSLCVEP